MKNNNYFILIISFIIISFIYVSCEDLGTQGLSGICDPIDPQVCYFPFPNNFWTSLDKSRENKIRLNFTQSSFPPDKNGRQPNTDNWSETLDGFSLSSPILTSWLGEVDLSNVAPQWNIGQSLDANHPITLLDYQTLEKIPHFGELDESSGETIARNKTFMVWPYKSLGNSRHVIVVFTGLKDKQTGKLFEPSEAYKALRDNIPNPEIDQRRAYYEDLFKQIEKSGIKRSETQLVFDFITASETSVHSYMLHMRKDMYEHIDKQTGSKYYIKEIVDQPNTEIARFVQFDFEVPLYLKNKIPGSHLVIGENNLPVFQKMVNYTFSLQIPNSLVSQNPDQNPDFGGSVLNYGHGLFGSQSEFKTGWFRNFINDNKLVGVSCDWVGMSSNDVPSVITMMATNFGNFRIIPDGLSQSMVIRMLMTDLVMKTLWEDPIVMGTIDPKKEIFYAGNSQGGISGATYMALEENIEKGYLGVPGAPYALMLFRSVDFNEYRAVINLRWSASFSSCFLINWIQSRWDLCAPGGYMHKITKDTFAETPKKQILAHCGISDSQVPYISAELMARSMDAKVFTGTYANPIENFGPEKLYGFEVIPEGETEKGPGAIYQSFYYDTLPQPDTNIPPEKSCDTHECPRRDQRSQKAQVHLFETGEFKNFCSETTGCDNGRAYSDCSLANDPLRCSATDIFNIR